jgi:hypothetical protein
MRGCLLGGFGDDRNFQTPADCLSDLSERHALFADGVIPGSRLGLLESQSVEAGSIEHVHCGRPPTARTALYPQPHAANFRSRERTGDYDGNHGGFGMARELQF